AHTARPAAPPPRARPAAPRRLLPLRGGRHAPPPAVVPRLDRIDAHEREVHRIGARRPGDEEAALGGEEAMRVVGLEAGARVEPPPPAALERRAVGVRAGRLGRPVDAVGPRGEERDRGLALERAGRRERELLAAPAAPR